MIVQEMQGKLSPLRYHSEFLRACCSNNAEMVDIVLNATAECALLQSGRSAIL
jgi:hypothetical protein